MTRALELAQTLLACLEAELTDAGYPYPLPSPRIMLRGGSEVTPSIARTQDECCPGLAWVRIANISGFRQELTDPLLKCFGQERTLTLELGVVRCMPTPGPDEMVTEDQWTDIVLKMDADSGAMERAICCLAAAEDDELTAVQAYVPQGPDGNCIGGTMTVNIRMEACC